MKNMVKYKEYYGSVNFDSDEPIFYGKLEFIKALISYEAKTAIGIKKAFEEAVDDYLDMCAQENIEPEKPFKGTFNVRTGHVLHEMIALSAKQEETSINKFVCTALMEKCHQLLQARKSA